VEELCFLHGPCSVSITGVCNIDEHIVQSREPRRLEIELENWAEFRESAVEGIRLCQEEDFACAAIQ
jgi:hypothetical protein